MGRVGGVAAEDGTIRVAFPDTPLECRSQPPLISRTGGVSMGAESLTHSLQHNGFCRQVTRIATKVGVGSPLLNLLWRLLKLR